MTTLFQIVFLQFSDKQGLDHAAHQLLDHAVFIRFAAASA